MSAISRHLPRWLLVLLCSLSLTMAAPAAGPSAEAQIRKPGDEFLKPPPGVPGWSELLRSEGGNSGTMCRLIKFMRALIPVSCGILAVWYVFLGAKGGDTGKWRLAAVMIFVGIVGWSSPSWISAMSPAVGQFYSACSLG